MGRVRAQDIGCLWTAHGRSSPRGTNHVEVPAEAAYTSGHALEKDSQNCHFCHFRHAQSDSQVPGLDPQVIPCEAYRTCRGSSWCARIPREYRCSETATAISAPCSLSQAETGFPDFAAAGIPRHRRASPTRVVQWRRRFSSFRSSNRALQLRLNTTKPRIARATSA